MPYTLESKRTTYPINMTPSNHDNFAEGVEDKKNKNSSLIKRVGGRHMIEQMVDILSTKVLSDETLAKFFEGVDMDQFESHQYRLFQLALTRIPLRFPEHMLYKHHRLFAAMGLNESHFDQLMVNVRETLVQCEVPYDAIDEIIAQVMPLRWAFEEGAVKFTKLDALSKSVGGADVVDAAMEEFAWHISEDRYLREILEGYDVEQIKEHQRRFFRLAMAGGPESTNVQKYLRGKHAHLFARGLSVRHFDALAGRFLDTLQSLRVDSDIVDKAKEFLRVAREAFDSKGESEEGEKATWGTTSWLNAHEL